MKPKKNDPVPSPWMLKGNSGETNAAFVGDDAQLEEAIQAKALPWRRGEVSEEVHPKVQEEFPPWINNKEYLPYASPTNTLLGKYRALKTDSRRVGG